MLTPSGWPQTCLDLQLHHTAPFIRWSPSPCKQGPLAETSPFGKRIAVERFQERHGFKNGGSFADVDFVEVVEVCWWILMLMQMIATMMTLIDC